MSLSGMPLVRLSRLSLNSQASDVGPLGRILTFEHLFARRSSGVGGTRMLLFLLSILGVNFCWTSVNACEGITIRARGWIIERKEFNPSCRTRPFTNQIIAWVSTTKRGGFMMFGTHPLPRVDHEQTFCRPRRRHCI